MPRSLRAVVVAAAAVLLIGNGCGGSSSSSPGGGRVVVEATPAALRSAAQATLAKGTSKVELTIHMTIEGEELSMSGEGAVDPANKRFHMTFDAKELFTKLAGPEGKAPEVAALIDEPFEVVLDGTVMYMRVPVIAAFAGSDADWFKIDLTAASEQVGNLLGEGGGAFGSDPSAFLQFLQGAGKVTEVGEEEVRGVSTTHFSGSYTLEDTLAALPDDQRDKVERAFKSLGLPGEAQTQEIPFDAWVDADGLIRRVRTQIDYATFAPATAAGELGSMSQTVEYFDFGEPVDIQLPADDEVQDLSELVGN